MTEARVIHGVHLGNLKMSMIDRRAQDIVHLPIRWTTWPKRGRDQADLFTKRVRRV